MLFPEPNREIFGSYSPDSRNASQSMWAKSAPPPCDPPSPIALLSVDQFSPPIAPILPPRFLIQVEHRWPRMVFLLAGGTHGLWLHYWLAADEVGFEAAQSRRSSALEATSTSQGHSFALCFAPFNGYAAWGEGNGQKIHLRYPCIISESYEHKGIAVH
jgi:hypothetical protein